MIFVVLIIVLLSSLLSMVPRPWLPFWLILCLNDLLGQVLHELGISLSQEVGGKRRVGHGIERQVLGSTGELLKSFALFELIEALFIKVVL